jgi:hypothetical protein
MSSSRRRGLGTASGRRARTRGRPRGCFSPVRPPARRRRASIPRRRRRDGRLVIAGTTDTGLFADFIAAFQTVNPTVRSPTPKPTASRFTRGSLRAPSRPVPDLLISSASDLQIKLANDGHALPHRTPAGEALPDWAQWRGEVIGFTFEPAVIVYNPTLLPPGTQPRTHRELAELLEGDPPGSRAASRPTISRGAAWATCSPRRTSRSPRSSGGWCR